MGKEKEKESKQAVGNWHHDEPIRDIRERGNQEQNWRKLEEELARLAQEQNQSNPRTGASTGRLGRREARTRLLGLENQFV